MSIRYECDDARRRVVIIVQDTIEPDDAFAVIERQRLDDTWSYGVLYDLRLMTGRLTLVELRPILGRASQRRAASLSARSHRSPAAIPRSGSRSRNSSDHPSATSQSRIAMASALLAEECEMKIRDTGNAPG